MYYKYRSLSNLNFALDILINKRLYASSFTQLNDPMEGVFTYTGGVIPKYIAKAIYDRKNEYKILSLCEEPNNMLMWSYYCSGHTGMVVGVNLGRGIKAQSVKYVDNFNIDNWGTGDPAREVLLRKHKSWSHEKEHRVLKTGGSFVKVTIREVIFGIETNRELKDLIAKIAKKFNPSVKILEMNRSDLNKGVAGRYIP